MPENKRQHFVPRFYLRRFSKDGKSINIWNIKQEKKILAANLRNQCYRNYFYGKNSVVEKALSTVEANAAQVLRSIEAMPVPPSPGSAEHQFLVLYILMQYGRTQHIADELDEMTDKLGKHLVKDTIALEGIDPNSLSIGLEEPALSALSIATMCYPILFDLECKILVNRTTADFVTSDNPVVFYNQLMSFRKDGSNTGFAAKGLKIFMPIDPQLTILLYDSHVYKVGDEKKKTVYINRIRDIEQLNILQICAASHNIYFRNDLQDLAGLHKKGVSFRNEAKSDVQVFQVDHSTEGEARELIRSSKVDIRTGLSPKFLSIRFSARKWRAAFRKMHVQPVSVIRNEPLMDAFEQFRTLVKEGKYTHGQFFDFVQDWAVRKRL